MFAEIPATEATSTSAPPPAKKFRRLASDSQNRARAAANNEAPAVLSGLDSELERYIAEMSADSAPCDVEIERGLTFWQDRQAFTSGTRSRCSPSITSICREGFFRCAGPAGTCQKTNSRTSARLEQRTFLRMNKQNLA